MSTYRLNSKSRLKLLGAHHSSFSLNRLNNWTHLNIEKPYREKKCTDKGPGVDA